MKKKIVFFFLILISIYLVKISFGCFAYLPFGFNGKYVHLPLDSSFCTNNENQKVFYKTNIYGGRLLINKKQYPSIEIFGDSQLVGLELNNYENHFIHKIYPKNNYILYAAPNNGPYEIIQFINSLEKLNNKEIHLNINASTDFFRISSNWNPKNYVSLDHIQLKKIMKYRPLYDFYLLKEIFINKKFSTERLDIEKMKRLFLKTNNKIIINDYKNFIIEIDEIIKKKNLEINLSISHPYWIYTIKDEKMYVDEKILNKYLKLIEELNLIHKAIFKKIYISNPQNNIDFYKDLTSDKRHINSKLFSFNQVF